MCSYVIAYYLKYNGALIICHCNPNFKVVSSIGEGLTFFFLSLGFLRYLIYMSFPLSKCSFGDLTRSLPLTEIATYECQQERKGFGFISTIVKQPHTAVDQILLQRGNWDCKCCIQGNVLNLYRLSQEEIFAIHY